MAQRPSLTIATAQAEYCRGLAPLAAFCSDQRARAVSEGLASRFEHLGAFDGVRQCVELGVERVPLSLFLGAHVPVLSTSRAVQGFHGGLDLRSFFQHLYRVHRVSPVVSVIMRISLNLRARASEEWSASMDASGSASVAVEK